MKVIFEHVLRSRPIVLTGHEVRSLSRVVGRDVLPELQAVCDERYEVMTLGQLMQKLVEVLSGRCQVPPDGWSCSRPKGHAGPCAATREHDASSKCWCCPTIYYKDAETGVAILVHNAVQ